MCVCDGSSNMSGQLRGLRWIFEKEIKTKRNETKNWAVEWVLKFNSRVFISTLIPYVWLNMNINPAPLNQIEFDLLTVIFSSSDGHSLHLNFSMNGLNCK